MSAQPDDARVKEHGIKYVSQFTQATSERLRAVAALVDEGTIKPLVDKTFPLEQAAEALEYQKTGSPKGKVVIQIKTE